MLQDENFSICSLKSDRSHLYREYLVRGKGHKVNEEIVVLRYGIIFPKDLLFKIRQRLKNYLEKDRRFIIDAKSPKKLVLRLAEWGDQQFPAEP